MLHKDPSIVSHQILTLTQELQSLKELEGFYLVGGTALALQLGHRNSVDIDLFSDQEFDYAWLVNFLKEKYPFEENFLRKNTIIGFINGIKVDFITHPFQYINPPITEEGVTFLSLQDIAAMKLHAIVNSGQRIKDFIYIYYLLERMSINEMINYYETKYPRSNPLIALKALSFFDDIDETIDPPRLAKPLPLKKLKARILNAVTHTNKIYYTKL